MLRLNHIPIAMAMAVVMLAVDSRSPCRGDVMITEIMYNPTGNDLTLPNEWVEIYNGSATTVDVTGWRLDDEDGTNWGTLSGQLLPYQVGIIHDADASDFRSNWGLANDVTLFGVNWAALANDPDPSEPNERLTLLDEMNVEIDMVSYDDVAPWPSQTAGYSIYLTNPGLDNSQGDSWELSSIGADGAFQSTSLGDIGSPGFVPGSSAQAVPEPSSVTAFMILAGCCAFRRRRRLSRAHESQRRDE